MTRALMIALAYVAVLSTRHRSRRGPGAGVVPIHQRPAHELRLLHLEQCLASRGAGSSHCAPNPAYTGDRSSTDGSQSVGRERRR